MTEGSLAGRTVAIAEARELDVFAALLERRGAAVLRYPLVGIADAPDPAPVLAWLRRFIDGNCDDLILLTGEGLRRLLRCSEMHEASLRQPFITRLGAVRKITRGPKPARALREIGLTSDLAAEVPTTDGVIATLRSQPLAGRCVGVQLYGSEPNAPLQDFLRAAGARVDAVAPYVYVDAASDHAVSELLARLEQGTVDAMAFTSKAQIERLFRAGDAARVRAALAATQVAAVGPVVAETLRGYGVDVSAMPVEAWFLKPLATALSQSLGQAP